MTLMLFSDLSDPIQTFRLENGLLLVVHSVKGPAIGLTYMVKCGPVYESPRRSGISHFLEHMLFRGIPEHPSSSELGLALDNVGVDPNAATFPDMTILSQKILPECLEQALRLFYSMLTEPVFEGMTAERKIILEECLEDMDEKGQLVAIDQLSSQLMYSSHPYSLPILGTSKVLERLKKSQLRNHLKRHYRPSASVLCVSGPITFHKAKKLSMSVFENWRNPKDVSPSGIIKEVPLFKGPKVLRVVTNKSQIQCRLSFKALPFTDPDYYKEKALLRILDSGPSSPLRKVLQEEKGFCYSLSAGIDSYEKAGAIHIDMFLQEERLLEGLSECLRVVSHINNTGVSLEMVERMISQYVKGKRFSSSDIWDFSGRFGFSGLFSIPYPFDREFLETQKLTVQEINEVAKKIFQRDNIGITLVGPVSDSLLGKIKRLPGLFHWN